MKNFLTLLLVFTLALTVLVGCVADDQPAVDEQQNVQTPVEQEPETDPEVESESEAEQATVMTYEEYVAAELDAPVVIEAYVQGKQSWWDNKATVYTQDQDGAYFLYEMACSEEDYALLENGTKIRVSGFKAEWAGEVEIVDATFEIVEGAQAYIATPVDATAWLGTDELIKHQNELVYFTGLTVEEITFKNEGGDDIYVKLSKDGQTYDFCVEYYLTGEDTEVYQAVSALNTGDVIDVTGFLYWYEGVNTHITSITVAE